MKEYNEELHNLQNEICSIHKGKRNIKTFTRTQDQNWSYSCKIIWTVSCQVGHLFIQQTASPGTLAIQRRCELQTLNDSKMSAGLLASITVTLLAAWVLVQIHTKLESCVSSSWLSRTSFSPFWKNYFPIVKHVLTL